MPVSSTARPSTGGTLGANSRLPSRGNSYSQPATATVAQTNAEGRFSQPKGKQYSISSPIAQPGSAMGQPSIAQPSAQPSAPRVQSIQAEQKGHRRSNTVSETLGRVTSMFSSRQPSYTQDPKESSTTQNSNHTHEKPQKSYPPTSMPGPVANDNAPRQSNESSRRTSFGFSRKTTNDSNNTGKSNRRFSLIPSSLSKTFSSNHRDSMPATTHSDRRGSSTAPSRPRATSRPGGMAFGRGGESRTPSQSTTGSNVAGLYDGPLDINPRSRAGPSSAPANQTQFDHPQLLGDDKFPGPREPHPSAQNLNRPYRHHNDSEASEPVVQVPSRDHRPQYPQGMGGSETVQGAQEAPRKGVLQKSRKFADAYDESAGNKGSSGSSKRVMDFFRRMGRQRGREDR
jgi:protein-serine/threonine kinase